MDERYPLHPALKHGAYSSIDPSPRGRPSVVWRRMPSSASANRYFGLDDPAETRSLTFACPVRFPIGNLEFSNLVWKERPAC